MILEYEWIGFQYHNLDILDKLPFDVASHDSIAASRN